MKRLKIVLLSIFTIITLMGSVPSAWGKDIYPKDWVLYMKKAGKEEFYLSFPSDPAYHIKKQEGGASYIELEASQGDSRYQLEVYPIEMFPSNILENVLKGQKDFGTLLWERETKEKFWKQLEGEYLFTEEEKQMIAQVKIMVSGHNVYAFFGKHPIGEMNLFEEFTSSFDLRG